MPKSSHLRWLALWWGIAATGGCAPDQLATLPESHSPAGVEFRVEATRYSRGDTAKLVLVNGTSDPIGYNLCEAELQRRVDGEWVFTARSPEQYWVCLSVMGLLAPGDTAVELQFLHRGVPKGVYRFAAEVDVGEMRRIEITSDGFVVR